MQVREIWGYLTSLSTTRISPGRSRPSCWRDKLQGGRILLQPTRFASERSILPLQFGDFLRRLNEILAGLDGLEKAAFAEDRIKKERASQEHNRQPDLSRTPALPL